MLFFFNPKTAGKERSCVCSQRDLIHEAQKAYHYGFDEHKALAAVTSVPAAALELGHRIGRYTVFYREDAFDG